LRNQPSSPLCACLRRPKRVPYLCSCGWISYPLSPLRRGADAVDQVGGQHRCAASQRPCDDLRMAAGRNMSLGREAQTVACCYQGHHQLLAGDLLGYDGFAIRCAQHACHLAAAALAHLGVAKHQRIAQHFIRGGAQARPRPSDRSTLVWQGVFHQLPMSGRTRRRTSRLRGL